MAVCFVEKTGHVNDGGTRSYTFTTDGGTSCSHLRPTLIFALFTRLVPHWQKFWHIRLPFRLSSLTGLVTLSLQNLDEFIYLTHNELL